MRSIASARIPLGLFAVVALLGAACQKDPTFQIRGRVAGLSGSGLTLHVGLAPDVPVAANGPVAFAGTWKPGTPFTVTVAAQPTAPHQTCTVQGAHATVQASDVLFTVTCVHDAYAVGGTLTGLVGQGLVLQNMGGDELALAADGTFTFAKPVDSGASYAVTVKTQPSGPAQTCLVSGGTGTMVAGAVGSVAVNCTTNTYLVSGTVSGLLGSGLLLQDAGADDLAVNANGTFAFGTPRASGTSYLVTVKNQPTAPAQTCAVTAGSGLVAGGPVTAPTVTCVTNTYAVGGTVSGLAGSGLVLRLNGGGDLAVGASGAFAFAGRVEAGRTFEVSVAAQPSAPWQACAVAGGSGTVVAGDVTGVAVVCATQAFAVGGNVTGLEGSGLTLQQSGGDDLAVSARGGFAFATPVASGATYAVTVTAQPTAPWQTCGVTAGTGSVAAAPVTDVTVSCLTDSFAIGGTVTGLAGGQVILGNGTDTVTVSGDGSFVLPAVASGASYAVGVRGQPTGPSQTCSVSQGSGVVAGAPVTSVDVTCVTNLYSVGGTATGMPPAGLQLGNGLDLIVLDFDGPYAFPTRVASGASYEVTVVAQPPTLQCSVAGAAGTVGDRNVTTADVSCACAAGLGDCDGNPGNGCEVDLNTSSANCGVCGNACTGGAACVGGSCGPL